jgi:hypothetical protein
MQVRAILPRPEFLPILGSRKAVNAQNDSAEGFSAACLAPPFQARGEKSALGARSGIWLFRD